MARLGSVLGAILAEIGRARMVSDHLSRDIVEQYRSDPILSSMSVPRLLIGQAELTLRFSVSSLDEAVTDLPTGTDLSSSLATTIAKSILPEMLAGRRLDEAERRTTVSGLVGPPDAPSVAIPDAALRLALSGQSEKAARAIAKGVMGSFGRLPRPIGEKLGSKAGFNQELESRLSAEIPSWIARTREIELVRSALASRIDVAVGTAELPTDPQKTQELKLTLRGEDLTLIIQSAGNP